MSLVKHKFISNKSKYTDQDQNDIAFISDSDQIYTHGKFFNFLSDPNKTKIETLDNVYLKIADAQKKYMPKGSTSSDSSASALSISTNGAFNNFGNNGQAFNAVRDVSSSNKYQLSTGSGFPLDAASFGIKDNGTTAFSHKKYDTFNKETGAATGARNTAVLVFSGKSGLLYAKNTGTASDVTDDMYKRVGVIDSPDDVQRVYSSAQADAATQVLIQNALGPVVENLTGQINALLTRIEDLESANTLLNNKLNLLCEKSGIEITDEELESLSNINIQAYSDYNEIESLQNDNVTILENLPNEIEAAIDAAKPKDFEKNEIDESNLTDV